MTNTKGTITIATHDGDCHMDEITALAVVIMWLEKKGYGWEATRTRDLKIIHEANIVLDVGGIYDPETRRFDHHQNSFTLKRENGITYASAGLAWLHYGLELCDGDEDIWNNIDKTIMQTLDAIDNGIDLANSIHQSGLMPLAIHTIVSFLKPTWQEDSNILHGVVWAMKDHMRIVLARAITHGKAFAVAKKEVTRCYSEAVDKRIIVFDKNYPWYSILSEFPEPMFVVYPRTNGQWGVEGVSLKNGSFERKAYLKEEWRGLANPELADVSGIADIVFCHKSGFKGAAQTKENALIMAERSLL